MESQNKLKTNKNDGYVFIPNIEKEPLDISNIITPAQLSSKSNNVFKLSQKVDVNVNAVDNSFAPDSVWLTGAPLIWKQGFTGKNCIVGIIDSGVDTSHPDIKNISKRMTFVGDEDYLNLNSHGTHVAGLIGANGKFKGMAPGCEIYDYRVFDENGVGLVSKIADAIIKACDDGCNIINVSVSTTVAFEKIESAVKYAISKGALITVGAGNQGDKHDWDGYITTFPAYNSDVLAVSAVDYDTKLGKISFLNSKFSNRNKHIDVAAKGYDVVSTIKGGKYAKNTGTTMACSVVTGFAALMHEKMKSFEIDVFKDDCNVNPLYNYVKNCAVPIDISSIIPNAPLINNVVGCGFLTAYPEVPEKDSDGNYYLPSLDIYQPKPLVDDNEAIAINL